MAARKTKTADEVVKGTRFRNLSGRHKGRVVEVVTVPAMKRSAADHIARVASADVSVAHVQRVRQAGTFVRVSVVEHPSRPVDVGRRFPVSERALLNRYERA